MTSDQVQALVQAHCDRDDARFRAVVQQMAAHAVANGRGAFATRLQRVLNAHPDVAVQLAPDVRGMIEPVAPSLSLEGDVYLAPQVKATLNDVIAEHKATERLAAAGLAPSRRLLFVGPPGNGKTTTALALARSLDLPVLRVNLEGLVKSYLGETGRSLAAVFRSMEQVRGVYLLDEFDAIAASRDGAGRGQKDDVGEMRRVVNTLLTLMDRDGSRSVLVAASNMEGMLDSAAIRRFDHVLRFEAPEFDAALDFMERLAARFGATEAVTAAVAEELPPGASYSAIETLVKRAARRAVVAGRELRAEDFTCHV